MHNKNHDQSFFVITELYSDDEGHSHFREISIPTEELRNLGWYSAPYRVQAMLFRNSVAGQALDLHTAPKKVYAVYLSGAVEIETSKGQKKTFKAGDILLANDLTGKGHKSTILQNGHALIIEAAD